MRPRGGTAAVVAACALLVAAAGAVVLRMSSPSALLTDNTDHAAKSSDDQTAAQGCEPDAASVETARERYPELAASEQTLHAMVCAEQGSPHKPDLESLREDARTGHPGPFAPTAAASDQMSMAMVDAWLLASTDFSDASRLRSLRKQLPHTDAATDALLRDVIAEWSQGSFLAAYALLDQAVDFHPTGCTLDVVACDESGEPIPPAEDGWPSAQRPRFHRPATSPS